MRVVAVSAILCLCFTLALAGEPLIDASFVDHLNAMVNTPWKADLHAGSRIEGITREQAKAMMGVKSRVKKLPRRVFTAEERAMAIPSSFDAKDKWPQCPTITHIRDQSACGSCWAVAAAEAISDRYCTLANITDRLISAANIMECCWWCGSGCQGGDPSSAWSDWTITGFTSDECQPYPFAKCEHHIPSSHYPQCPSSAYPTPSCSTTCTSNSTSSYRLYKGKTSYSLSGVEDFQREIMTNGPIEVAFDVYKDLLSYRSGVYVQHSQDYLGGHAVKMVGWGTLNGMDYWKIANSWNRDWGMDGYFLIERGVDMCGIEDSGVAGSPV